MKKIIGILILVLSVFFRVFSQESNVNPFAVSEDSSADVNPFVRECYTRTNTVIYTVQNNGEILEVANIFSSFNDYGDSIVITTIKGDYIEVFHEGFNVFKITFNDKTSIKICGGECRTFSKYRIEGFEETNKETGNFFRLDIKCIESQIHYEIAFFYPVYK